MQFFEKTVSNLIENQFPDVYRDNGADFVEFVKAYYEWLETEGQALYQSRRVLENRDVDTTVDSFLIHFKNKYLNNIQFETASSARNMVKHSLDLYRSKGTERAIDLFFRNIFGTSASIYFPERDIFKASSGKWIVPKYLEIIPTDNMKNFIGLEIKGIDSGATAFVDRLVRTKAKDSAKFIYVYYLSNLAGFFRAGEMVQATSTNELGPIIIGSMNELTVITGGLGYEIGDIVDISSSSTGGGGSGRVANVASVSGKISFKMVESGWGYNDESEVLISNSVFSLSNVSATNTSGNGVFSQFETIVQPTSNISYTSLTGLSISVGDTLYRTDTSTNTVFTTGRVVLSNPTSNTTGHITVSTVDGSFTGEMGFQMESGAAALTEDSFNLSFEEQSLDENFYIYKYADPSNTSSYLTRAVISHYTNESATANVIKISELLNISISNSISQFVSGNFVYQTTNGIETANAVVSIASYNGANASIVLSNTSGVFRSNTNLYSRNSNANGFIGNISTTVGIINTSGNFNINPYNMIYGQASGTTASLQRISTGFGASFKISPTFLYQESKNVNIDYIGGYVDIDLDAEDYGFPVPGEENLDTIITDALTYEESSYGKIYSIIPTNAGLNYDAVPFVVIYDKQTAALNKRDFIVNIATSNGTFTVGEVVQQNSLNRGIVKASSNATVLQLERITFDEIGVPLGEETDPELDDLRLVGVLSGATAMPISVAVNQQSAPIGINAKISANSAIALGSVSTLQVIDSGFGYADGETVQFRKVGDAAYGTASVTLATHGTGLGFHRNNNSVLSGNKYLRDGNYYQQFSYEIRSNITLDRYSDMLKNIIHMAGTKFYARYVSETTLESTNDINLEVTLHNG